jgi:hypothetical protein
MARRRANAAWVLTFLAVLGLVLLAPAALAQNLRFTLDENRVNLYLNSDGTVLIVYDMTFTCDLGADPITDVDIGMPNGSYSLADARASVDGTPLTNITKSPYVNPGVAVGLGSHAIRPGQTGTLHVEVPVQNMFYQDSKDPEYASIEFAPHYYGSDFVHGTTLLEVTFHFPPGVTSEEPRYHGQQFSTAGFDDSERAFYTWTNNNASGSQKYQFGASFPKKYLAEGVVQKPPAFNLNLGSLCASPVLWFVVIGGGMAGLAFLGSASQKQRKMQYLPPSLGVEGVGIKRGLTAVEAAILLEAPLNKVLTMILFALVKKGQIIVESQKPLKVQATNAPLGDTQLRDYETRFLSAVAPDGTLKEKALREMVIDLIADVNKKMTGFSRKESVAYYQDIAARAWKQVEAADTPEVLGARWGEGFEWTMLDKDWDDHTRRAFQDRPVVLPTWWGGYRPWVSGGTPSRPSVPSPVSPGQPVTLPTLPGADFANTVVTHVENAANTVVGSVERFAGGVTDKTNPVPVTSSSGSRSGGGGHSCACACACAGCACACAGGGR